VVKKTPSYKYSAKVGGTDLNLLRRLPGQSRSFALSASCLFFFEGFHCRCSTPVTPTVFSVHAGQERQRTRFVDVALLCRLPYVKENSELPRKRGERVGYSKYRESIRLIRSISIQTIPLGDIIRGVIAGCFLIWFQKAHFYVFSQRVRFAPDRHFLGFEVPCGAQDLTPAGGSV